MKKKLLLLSLFYIFFLVSCVNVKEINNEGRVYYEIFVRSFADSDGDGIGDFNGVTQKLDYLENLGIKGIWLMPIFPSPSYHGYDITDYKDVNNEYGSMSDFENLIKEAHKKDIKVILDFVINHTSSKHPWFIDAKNPNSKYIDYYRFKTKYEAKTGPWYSNSINGGNPNDYYYAYFWDQMPDLNYDNPKVLDEMINNAKFWLKKGVDGFRIDAALHIFTFDELYNADKTLLRANIDFFKDFRSKLRKINKNVYTIGEVWTSQQTVAAFYEGLDSNFNFDLAEKIVNTAKSQGNLNYSKQIQTMYDTIGKYTDKIIDLPFLSNHDQVRLMTKVNNDMAIAKLCAEMFLTLKGNPFIYYGEEIGMKGYKPPDEDVRTPFIWSHNKSDLDTKWYRGLKDYNSDVIPQNIQINDPNSLLNLYITLINIRSSNPALAIGDFKSIKSDIYNLQMFLRVSEKNKQAILVIHNFSNNEYVSTLKTNDLKLIYQSHDNVGKNDNIFARKSTKIYEVPFDKYKEFLP